MTDETTTEQLAEIEGQVDTTPVTEYTPPEGWRVLAVGEKLQAGDMTVRSDGYCYSTERVGYYVGLNQRYIRRIEPEPESQPEHSGFEGKILREQPQPVQVREGRWRTRNGEIRHVTPTPHDLSDEGRYLWHDAEHCQTWHDNGRYFHEKESPFDLLDFIGSVESDKTQELPDKTQELPEYTPPEGWRVLRFGELLQPGDMWVNQDGTERRSAILHWDAAAVSGGRCIRRIEPQLEPQPQAATIEELRSEVSYVQNLLGESRQRVTQLEELVTSLRTINEAQEKAFNAAGKENTDLQHRLNVVAAEWAEQAETIRRLQIELDAREQVPEAVSDRFDQGFEQGTSRAVETIAEWTEPFRTCGSQALAYHVMQNLPHIMRSLTGLADAED